MVEGRLGDHPVRGPSSSMLRSFETGEIDFDRVVFAAGAVVTVVASRLDR
jgi:hypothetical protein